MNIPNLLQMPPIKPGDQVRISTLEPNEIQVIQRTLKVLSFSQADGRAYITADDFCVYDRYPLLNLHTGKVEQLWVRHSTPTPTHPHPARFDGFEVERTCRPPHARTIKLFKRNLLSEYQRRTSSGYIHPGYITDVIQDNGGHWWSGGVSRTVRKFAYRPPIKEGETLSGTEPKVAFITPYLNYLGADDNDKIMWSEHPSRSGTKYQLTICTAEVCSLIQKANLWGHYFPTGEARHDVQEAEKGLAEVKARTWDYDELKARVIQLEKDLATEKVLVEAAHLETDKAKNHIIDLEKTNTRLKKGNVDIGKQLKAYMDKAAQSREFNPLWGT